MIAAVIIFLGLALASVGWGALLLRLLAPDVPDRASISPGIAGMSGLFVAGTIGILVNFWQPLTWHLALVVFCLGLLAFVVFASRQLNWFQWVAIAFVCVVFAPLTALLTEGYDGGVYHIPVELWIVEEKIVVGLTNLHSRYGINSINEPLLALGWLPGNDLAVARLMSGLSVAFLLLTLIDFARSPDSESDVQYLAIFLAVGVGLIWALVMRVHGWTNTDVPAAAAALMGVLAGYVAVRRADSDMLVVSFFLIAVATLMKTSAIVAVLLPLGAAAVLMLQRGWAAIPVNRILLIGLLCLPWLVRGVVTSGCLFYPVTSTCLPLPWVGADTGVSDSNAVIAWARAPGTGLVHLAGWDWIPLWFRAEGLFLIYTATMAALGVALPLLFWRHGPATGVHPYAAPLLATGWAIVSVAFWFIAAPAPRFGLAAVLILAALPGLWLLVVFRGGGSYRWTERGAPLLLIPLSLALPLAYSAYRSDFGATGQANSEPGILGYRPLHFLDVPVRVENGVSRPEILDRCMVTPRPCSPSGSTESGRLASYVVYYPDR